MIVFTLSFLNIPFRLVKFFKRQSYYTKLALVRQIFIRRLMALAKRFLMKSILKKPGTILRLCRLLVVAKPAQQGLAH